MERLRLADGEPDGLRALESPLGFNGCPSHGLLVACGPEGSWEEQMALKDACGRLRGLFPERSLPKGGLGPAATIRNGVLCVRALGAETEGVKEILTEAWKIIRPGLLGREAVLPRIWRT